MKRALLAVLSGVLLCGCTPKNQDVQLISKQIDDLARTQDVLLKNQEVIMREMAFQATNLPSVNQMFVLAAGFYTNEVNAQLFCTSNVLSAMSAESQKSVNAINDETRRLINITSSMLLTNDNQIQMEAGVEKIKSKLEIN